MSKLQHSWHRDKCTVCGIERDADFIRENGTFRVVWKYCVPDSDKWETVRPYCFEREVEDKKNIIQKVNDYFGVNVHERTRRRKVCFARQVAVELLWNFGGMSMEAIGATLGIDRTTGIVARRVVWRLCASDPEIRQKVIELETMIE